MMQSMRKGAKSFLAFILFGLLILSFGIWGIGDIFRPGVSGNATVAEVGAMEISAALYRRELHRELQGLQRRFGTAVDLEQARRLGVHVQVLSRMVNSLLFDLGARDLGMAVSEEVTAGTIRNDPLFRDQFGRFDPDLFRRIIQNAGVSENGYVAIRRNEIVRAQLAGTVARLEATPKRLVDALYRHREERRVARILFVPTAAVADVGRPDDATLAAYHKKNGLRYTAPEFRELAAVILRPEALAAEIKVSETQLKEAYADRKAEFDKPERRTVEQILVSDEATAKRVHAALASGRGFAEVAKDVAGQADGPLSLGSLTRGDIAVTPVEDAVFALERTGFSQPVKSGLGWHLLNVTAIEPAKPSNFGDARKTLEAEIQKEMAVEALIKLSNDLEDALGGGATLEEGARGLDLKVTKIESIDARGRKSDGKPVAGLPDGQEFIREAFRLQEGEDSLLVETEYGGAFIVRVDSVTPSALRPLESIREKVIGDWRREERLAAAGKKAAGIAEQVKGGADLAKFGGTGGLEIATTKAFTRDGRDSGNRVSAELAAKLFAARRGEAVTAPAADGHVVAVLQEVRDARPSADRDAVRKLEENLRAVMTGDILAQFGGALRERYPVEVNQDTFQAIAGQ